MPNQRRSNESFNQFASLEKIHLIAHSRGTDSMVSALRELVIWASGAGLDPVKHYKIANLILAAADLDLQVTGQKVISERLGLSVGQMTIYTSPEDEAIGMAQMLFASPRGRVGRLERSKLDAGEKSILGTAGGSINIVRYDGYGEEDTYGHSYFRTNPSVSSDVVLDLRHGYKPGSAKRPLEPLGGAFWRIPQGYPMAPK
jgi:esterase/lipase superfamily enzyme